MSGENVGNAESEGRRNLGEAADRLCWGKSDLSGASGLSAETIENYLMSRGK